MPCHPLARTERDVLYRLKAQAMGLRAIGEDGGGMLMARHDAHGNPDDVVPLLGQHRGRGARVHPAAHRDEDF